MTHTIDSIAQQLIHEEALIDEPLHLQMGDYYLDVRSNSKQLIAKLSDYFADCDVLAQQQKAADDVLIAIESAAPELGIDFIDWKREPGKTGRKDEYFDIKDDSKSARIVRKVRTGMVFLQSEQAIIAAGPCVDNDNQIINFINSQYMNWLQQRDWLICHASGLAYNNKGLAMAGFSGGGKSTLMLDLMNNSDISFVSNDRLFVQRSANDSSTTMLGIAKLPRINPGTIVGNPVLHPIMSNDTLAHYQAMETAELWHIEEKYDASINQIYGDDHIRYNCPLNAFVILNWQRDSKEPVQLTQVNLQQRRDLLNAIMKSSGPFYMDKQGNFQPDDIDFDEESYLSILSNIAVYEAHGGVDFSALSALCLDILK